MTALETAVDNEPADAAVERIEQAESDLRRVAGTSGITAKLSKARSPLKDNQPEPKKAIELLGEGLALYGAEVDWHRRAAVEIAPALNSIRHCHQEFNRSATAAQVTG